MRITTYLAISYLSFFSGELYKFIAHKWQNTYGTRYAFYLAFLISIFSAISAIIFLYEIDVNKPQYAKQTEYSAYLSNIINQIPDFTISKGQLILDNEDQYIINDPKTTKPLIILDNSPSPKFIIDKTTIATINKNELTLYTYSPPKRYSLQKLFPQTYQDDITINKEKIIFFLKKVKIRLYFFIILLYLPFIATISFFWMMVKTIILSLVIRIVVAVKQRVRLPIKLVIRTLIVSSTPPLVIEELGLLISDFSDQSLALFRFFTLILTVLYSVFALKVIIREQKIYEYRN